MMFGTSEMNPKTKVAIEPNFYSTEVLVCRKMKMLKRANMNIGMKMVAQALPGNLYNGTMK